METKVAYLCDGLACPSCSEFCNHTFDISHAKNFKMLDKTLAVEMTEEEKKEKLDTMIRKIYGGEE